MGADNLLVTDIDKMTIAELDAYRQKILRAKEDNTLDIGKLKTQIEHAKARVIETGRYSSPTWFAQVNTELRRKGRRDQILANELGRAAIRIRDLHVQGVPSSFEHRFIDVAKRKLTGEQFAEIVALAREASAAADD